MDNEIKREAICKYLSIVGNALDAILLAERTRDGRKRDKEIRKAKEEAHNMVYSYKADLADICNLEVANCLTGGILKVTCKMYMQN